MIIPDIVLAIALLSFFTLLEVTLGLHSIILSHVVFNIAFVCAVVRTRLKAFRSQHRRSLDRPRRQRLHHLPPRHPAGDLSGRAGRRAARLHPLLR